MRQLNLRSSIFLITIIVIASFLPKHVNAQIIVKDATYSIRNDIYQDVSKLIPSKELTFQDVLKDTDFEPISHQQFGVPNFGLQKHSIWLKFKIKSNVIEQKDFVFCVENPNLRIANLYRIDSIGNIDSQKCGNILPFKKRLIRTPDFAFHLHLEPNSQYTYYLQLNSDYPLFVPLAINKPKAQFNNSAFKNGVSFAFLGILLAMLIYNAFIAVSTRDNAYWFYVLYLFFLGLAQLSILGYAYMYFWPNYPSFNRHSVTIFSILGGLFALLFAENYLKLRKKKIKWAVTTSTFIFLIFIIALILDLLHFRQLSFQIMQLNTLFASIIYLIISFLLLNKDTNAKYFFIAWSLLIVSAVIFILKDYNVLPLNKVTEHIVQIGSVAEIILLSFGLANRINYLREQRDRARIAELEMIQKNEKLVKDQNVILNKKVQKRTVELVAANRTLNQTLENLKQTQSKLVATEKMSSLGQLTAGIAHEINNPINFVSANVSPLKRDINQLFDAITQIEKIGVQDKPAAIKKEEIAAYKEETELSYIQSEINHLLNGIHEGASRTAEIVKGLRVFSRLDEDSWKPVDINEGLKSTIAITSNLMRGVELDLQLAELPLVTCYPGKLNQVFLNIITNAIYAIHKHHGNDVGGTLTIKSYCQEESVFVAIKDDGIGMDETTISKLFDPFFTTKPVGEGTGLGMSIVFSILEKHHAKCEILSEPGKGTEFILQFHIDPEAPTIQSNESVIQNAPHKEVSNNS